MTAWKDRSFGGDAGSPGWRSRMARWFRELRPPVVHQADASDCGPAALLSLLRFWGGNATLAEVRELAGTGAGGSSLLGLRDAARALGLSARGATGELADLRAEGVPCVALLESDDGRNHFVAVSRVDDRGVQLADPARGRRRMSSAAFEAAWRSRAVLLVSATPAIRRSPSAAWFAPLLRGLRAEPAWAVQALFLGVVSTGVGLLTALCIRWLIDRFIPARDLSMVYGTGAALAILLVVRIVCGHLRQRYVLHLGRGVSSSLNEDFFTHLFRLPLQFFEGRTTGDLTTRFGEGLRAYGTVLELGGGLLIDGLISAGAVGTLFLVAPPFGLVAAAVLPFYAVGLVSAARRIRGEHRHVLTVYGQAESAYIDGLEGVEDVQLLARDAFFARRTAGVFDMFLSRSERLGLTHATIASLSELVAGVLIVGVLIWGALLVIESDLMLGQLMAGYSLLAGAAPAVDRLARASVGLQEAAVAARRFNDVLETPPQPREGGGPVSVSRELRLEDVGVRWPNGDRLFSGLDLAIPFGRVTGVSGANGVGKTTLIRLLCRALGPTDGRILADGVPIDQLALAPYRREVVPFGANTHLFDGTLAHNVLLGRSPRDPAAALAGLVELGFARFLERFPTGWGTRVGPRGRRLSSGERQVVGLMRALVDRPSVVLVDEGVSGTDPNLTRSMLDALVGYGREHVVLLVSHDARVLRCAEHVFLLAAGGMRAQGRPEDILGRDCEGPLEAEPMCAFDRSGGRSSAPRVNR